MGDEEGKAKQEVSESNGGGASKAIVVFLGLCYAVGLLTFNLFLHSHGITDFTLVRPRAILTGAIVIGSLSLIAFGPITGIAKIAEAPSRKLHRVFGLITKLVLPLLALVPLCWRIEHHNVYSWEAIDRLRPERVLFAAAQFYLASCASAVLAVQVVRIYPFVVGHGTFVRMANAWGKLIIYSTALVVAVAWYINTFAGFVYMDIPRQFGGGEPDNLRFEIRQEFVPDVKAIGVPFVPSTNITFPLTVIHETDDSFFFVLNYHYHERNPQGMIIQPLGKTTATLGKKAIESSMVEKWGLVEAVQLQFKP